ncbi:carbon-nitrogen family hydrolase [Paraliomyxa miuraensis]|uniref:carbon-nitrogen family hydrolase n=1 Tax=Paraliomyxa miuraensis TaxID=376150 RepID=UPI00225B9368|nr:carbon-nitrogen family hydrolase [Paraliomyxa miuraensis]MCX4245381.1 carbon-nitrogen family hydrolase [Paraliomyxa miuraensis]
MKVAALQLDIAWESPAENYERVLPWIRTAVAAGARLLVLPEMYACGFSMQAEAVAEPENGPSTTFLVEQARAHDLWIGGSVPVQPEGAPQPFNTFVLAGPRGELHRYRKIHPFTFADEHLHYGAGDRHVTVDVEGVRCTLFVCYDLRFADEMWTTARDTDCYLFVANWPEKRRHHWMALLLARAIENQAYVVGVNRVGEGGGIAYSGDSRIVDPWGEFLATAAGKETLLLAEVDPAVVSDARTRFPVLQDRR